MMDRYEKRKKNLKKRNIRSLSLLLALVLLVGIGAGASVAFLITDSKSVTNHFVPGTVDCRVVENADGTVCIQVTEDSNVSGYIRAAILINWVDKSGNVYAIAPQGCRVSAGAGWSRSEDGHYYYDSPVAPGAVTTLLVTALELPDDLTAPEGFTLQMEILAETIQAGGGVGHTPSDWGKAPSA